MDGGLIAEKVAIHSMEVGGAPLTEQVMQIDEWYKQQHAFGQLICLLWNRRLFLKHWQQQESR